MTGQHQRRWRNSQNAVSITYSDPPNNVPFARHRNAIKYTTSQFSWISYQQARTMCICYHVTSSVMNRTVKVQAYCCNNHVPYLTVYYPVSHAMSGSCVYGQQQLKCSQRLTAMYSGWGGVPNCEQNRQSFSTRTLNVWSHTACISASSYDRILLTPEREVSIRTTFNIKKLNICKFRTIFTRNSPYIPNRWTAVLETQCFRWCGNSGVYTLFRYISCFRG
jgi:hypothetical protein